MYKNIIKKTCEECGYYGDFEEILTEQDEYFINCNRCGYFKQKMIKNVINDINKIKETFPNHTEDEKFITVIKGGFGTWKIIQNNVKNEGSFVDQNHINDFISNIEKIINIEGVTEVSYNIKVNNNWEYKEIKKPS